MDTAQRERYAAAERARYAADPEFERARKRRAYRADPEPARARARAHRAAGLARRGPRDRAASVMHSQTRRARLADAFVEPIHPLVVMEISDGICGICGIDIPIEEFTVDHILPLAGGGEHSYENVQGGHASCNHQKGAH